MKRRTFLRSTIAAAVATSIPGRRSLAALYWPVAQVPPDVDAITGDGREVTLKGKAVQELAASLKGHLLLADDEGYERRSARAQRLHRQAPRPHRSGDRCR